MGTPLAQAFIRIRPETDGFRKDTERELGGDLVKAGTSLGKTLGTSLAKSLGASLEKAANGMGKSVADEFADAFTERVKERTKDAPLAPSKPRTRKQGEESAGTFAGGFRKQLQQAAKSLPPINVGVAKNAAEQQLRDLQAQLRALAGKTIGVDVDAAAALAEVRTLQGKLTELSANSPDIQVRTDTAAALAKLAQITAAADKLDGTTAEVEVEVDTDRASRTVSTFASGMTGVLAKAFGGVSSTAGSFFQNLSDGAMKAGGQISTSLIGAAAATTAMTAGTGGLNLLLGALAAALLAGAAATVGLGAAFVALAPVLLAAGGLMGGFVSALFGGAAAAAVFKFGLGGIGGALTSMSAAQDEAAKSAVSFAGAQNAIKNASDQVRSALAAQKNTQATVAEAAKRAAQQITDAERAVGQARRDSARAAQDAQQRIVDANQRVRDAQRALTDAEQDALQVREDLTRAQEDARRNLEDLASAVKNNSLDQQQARLDVVEAERELQKVMADPKATAEQKRQAQITYDRQVQQLKDLQTRGKRLADEQADAAKKGVNGSDQVVDARNRIAEADERIADARRGVSDAQTQLRRAERDADESRLDSQQKVAAAERALADARAARESQQRQGAYQLAQASQAVVSAQRALAQASTQAGTAGGSAMQKLNQQMAELSPNARELVRTLDGLRGPFGELRRFVQDRLLEGVATQVKDLAGKWLPALRPMLGNLATEFNKVGDGLFRALGRTDFIANVKTAVAGFGDMIGRIGKSIPGLVDAFGRIGAASTPVLRVLGELIGGIFDKFSAWIRSADQTGKLDTFMRDAAATLRQIFSIGGLVVKIAGEIFRIFFPQSKQTGDGFLGGVEDVLRVVLTWLRDPKNQQAIRDWVAGVGDFVKFLVSVAIPSVATWVTTVSGWIDDVLGWINTIKGLGQVVGNMFGTAVRNLVAGWATIRDKVFTPLRTAVTSSVPNAFRDGRDRISARFGEARDRLSNTWARIRDNTFTPLRNAITTTIPNAFASGRDKAAARFAELRTRLGDVWGRVRDNVLTPLRNAITSSVPNAFRTGVDAVKRQWDRLINVAKTPVRFVIGTVLNNGLIAGYNKVAKVFGVQELAKIALPKGFATGGVLPGYTPGRDVHRFVSPTGGVLDLSGGEPVMRPEFGRVVGKGWVDRVNQAARTGGVGGVRKALSGSFARGGVIGGDGFGDLWAKVKGKASDVLDGAKKIKDVITDPVGAIKGVVNKLIGLIPGQGQPWGKLMAAAPRKLVDAAVDRVSGFSFTGSDAGGGPGNGASPFGGSAGMMRALRGTFPGLRLISGFRPGAVTLSGNPSYHGRDRAVDLEPIRSVAKHIFDKFRGITRELITPFQEYNLLNGRKHTYRGAVWNQHNFDGGNAHNHWAAKTGKLLPKNLALRAGGLIQHLPFGSYDSGGRLPTGLSLAHNGTGRPEPVGHHLGGNTYHINVSVPVGAHPAQVGKEIVAAIKAYESGSGTTWRK
ncbi:hypothetical protein AB0F72_09005 [Actinoplanes sp. NPDC023936]|uniref:hypothetical protein n=1 Tax=Actinoplanes sp. NPDC023936 TaxID=3154910 RepID=UPI0033C38A1A